MLNYLISKDLIKHGGFRVRDSVLLRLNNRKFKPLDIVKHDLKTDSDGSETIKKKNSTEDAGTKKDRGGKQEREVNIQIWRHNLIKQQTNCSEINKPTF